MTTTTAALPAIGSRCWRDLVSPATGAMVLSFDTSSSPVDPMVELSYEEGGSGWWPLTTLVFSAD
ncbi:hypothetical protein KQ306_08855 [Synechococcus sp. CS-1324]|uniref:hypothetical protein n=1 Tax=Synechococcus sp. CS-1324 TaxID=2847980 RepID=UPI000DB6771A|nr:hypothetical protein [Synechococcus sp. CS-1324]MCT0230957.1 hypothetical protein [Synechococcus sp. CS-1324]PZV04190.1 MAG: hypothetical protein DCF23_07130 [Cyanobium sp.]